MGQTHKVRNSNKYKIHDDDGKIKEHQRTREQLTNVICKVSVAIIITDAAVFAPVAIAVNKKRT